MTQLQQKLTVFDLTMIAIGSTIGSGIFLTPSLIAKALPAPLWILLVWVLGGLMALAGALTYAELGAMVPRAGGIYVYLTETYGGLAGFLCGWAYFLVVNTGAIAALSVAFATYFGYFIPVSPVELKIVAVAGIVIVTVINVLGVKAGGVFSDIFTILKLAGIIGLIIIGIGWGTSEALSFTDKLESVPNGLGSALAVAMVGVLWSYGGWQHATFVAGEARDAKRSVPLAMILGALAVMLIYVLTNVAYLFLLSPKEIGASSAVASDAIESILGPMGGRLIALAIFISTFGTAGIYTLTAPRIYYAMANDGVFFRKVAEVHPRYHTPAFAILCQSLWAILLILFWGTFENLISYVVFTDWIFFALTAASVFVLRRRLPNAERSYKTLGYPLTPLFFVAMSVWFIINTLVEKPAEAWAGIGFLALGVPVYYWWKRIK
jgi:APA family basic amino acid/polyamine antiporter